MSFVFDLVSFVLGAVACVSSQVVYNFVKKQVTSAKTDISADVTKVEADVKADVTKVEAKI
jgi:hypothetical protein